MACVSENTPTTQISTPYFIDNHSNPIYYANQFDSEQFRRIYEIFFNKANLKINISERQNEIFFYLVKLLNISNFDLSQINFDTSIEKEIIIYKKNTISLNMISIDDEGDIMIGYTSLENEYSNKDWIKFFEYENVDAETSIYFFLS